MIFGTRHGLTFAVCQTNANSLYMFFVCLVCQTNVLHVSSSVLTQVLYCLRACDVSWGTTSPTLAVLAHPSHACNAMDGLEKPSTLTMRLAF